MPVVISTFSLSSEYGRDNLDAVMTSNTVKFIHDVGFDFIGKPLKDAARERRLNAVPIRTISHPTIQVCFKQAANLCQVDINDLSRAVPVVQRPKTTMSNTQSGRNACRQRNRQCRAGRAIADPPPGAVES